MRIITEPVHCDGCGLLVVWVDGYAEDAIDLNLVGGDQSSGIEHECNPEE